MMMKRFVISVALLIGLAVPAQALPELRFDTYKRDEAFFTPHERAAIFGFYDWYSDVPGNKRKRALYYDHYSPYVDDFERNRVEHNGKPPQRYRDALKGQKRPDLSPGDVVADLSNAAAPPKALDRKLNDRAFTHVVLIGPHLVLLDSKSGQVLDLIPYVAR